MTERTVPYRDTHPQFKETWNYYKEVPLEMIDGFWNYLAYGLEPGSFGMAILRNDFMDAVCRAHPNVTSLGMRGMAKWWMNVAPPGSYGSREAITRWIAKTDEERRDIMIECKLRPSEFDILRGLAVA